MNRRGFLKGILAAGVAPAFIGSDVLMPVRNIKIKDEGVFVFDHYDASALTLDHLREIQRRANQQMLTHAKYFIMVTTPQRDNAMQDFGIDIPTAKFIDPHRVIVQDRLPGYWAELDKWSRA